MTEIDIAALDEVDTLASCRDLFDLPTQTIYLNGNSLGPLCHASAEAMQRVVSEEWGQDLISSWNKHRWIDFPLRVGARIAPLLGAAPEQVLCCDSVSVNLFKLLSAALALSKAQKPTILSHRDNFPTDLYIAEGLRDLLQQHGAQAELKLVATNALEAAIAEGPAVLMLTHVDFRTGRKLDMAKLTRLAHQHGVLVIWDLSHSAGVIDLALDDCQVDFAVGCGYKFLNGGPGAPAFVYVASRHLQQIKQPLQGWMGHKAPFAFNPDYEADLGINQLQTGTPSVLAMSALDAALSCFEGVRVADLNRKASALSETFLSLVEAEPALAELRLVSPRNPEIRGAQLSFSHDQAYPISQALIAAGVIVDFRAPNLLRLGFSPLYLSFADIAASVSILNRIIVNNIYKYQQFSQRKRVT
ncbi:MAG TPA: kynureninase [Gammaproteobacteria bacterium]|nr:kynureninase [Gammaproteobacteria bacterium]